MEDSNDLSGLSLNKLKALLAKSISEEAYEKASTIRDEIDNRSQKP